MKNAEAALFQMVKKQQLKLTGEDQLKYYGEIHSLLTHLQYEIFSNPDVVVVIFQDYAAKKFAGESLAKFGFDYNSSISGRNKKIEERIIYFMEQAQDALKNQDMDNVVNCLMSAQLDHSVYLNKTIRNLVPNSKVFKEIEEIQWTLVRSFFQLIADIAKQENVKLTGGILSYEDLLQQGLIAAQEAILTFDPVNHNTVLSTYVYYTVKRSISKYITEQNRTVTIPRYLIDRYAPVAKAIEKVGVSDIKLLTTQANLINFNQKTSNVGRKLKRSELYTEEEIQKLLQVTQSEMSLDVDVSESPEGLSTSFGDIIEDDSPTPEVYNMFANAKDALKNLLFKKLSADDAEVLVIRWGLEDGTPKGLEEAARIFKDRTGKTMNKGKLKEIESRCFGLLRSTESEELKVIDEVYSKFGGDVAL